MKATKTEECRTLPDVQKLKRYKKIHVLNNYSKKKREKICINVFVHKAFISEVKIKHMHSSKQTWCWGTVSAGICTTEV